MNGWRVSSALLKYGGATLLLVGLVSAAVLLLVHEDSPARQRWAKYEAYLDTQCKKLFLETSGYVIARSQLLIAALGTAFLLVQQGVASALLTFEGWKPILILNGLAWGGPLLWLWLERRKRLKAIEQQVEKWLQLLSNAVRATPALGEALASSGRLLDPPMSQELDLVVKEFQLGRPLDDAISAMAARVGSRLVAAASSTILIGRETGGDLPKTLANAAQGFREIQRLERLLQSKTAEARTQLYVIGAAPFGMYFALNAVSPSYLAPLFEDPIGAVMLTVAVGFWISGVFVARKILAVEL